MEDIPATSPVLLTLEQKMYLLRVLGEWSEAVGGYDAMPPGLFELRDALIAELRDAERGQATALSSHPPASVLATPGALLVRSHLRELGLERRAVDAIFRELHLVVLPGYSAAVGSG